MQGRYRCSPSQLLSPTPGLLRVSLAAHLTANPYACVYVFMMSCVNAGDEPIEMYIIRHGLVNVYGRNGVKGVRTHTYTSPPGCTGLDV
jgi:hypothetical protein